MKTSSEVTQGLNAIFDNPQGIDALPPEARINALLTERTFTSGVDLLRKFAVPEVRELAKIMWDVIGHSLVQVAISAAVPTMSFVGVQRGGIRQACVLVPQNWVEMVKANEVLQAGALIYNGSMAVDFYNDRCSPTQQKDVETRAQAYEAEFLKSVHASRPEYALNAYQQKLLETFPDGVRSARVAGLMYKSKPFFIAQA